MRGGGAPPLAILIGGLMIVLMMIVLIKTGATDPQLSWGIFRPAAGFPNLGMELSVLTS